jgi:hypothetical protein
MRDPVRERGVPSSATTPPQHPVSVNVTFIAVPSFAAGQFFGRRPWTDGSPAPPLAAHLKALAKSIQTRYCRPQTNVVTAYSIHLQLVGRAKMASSLVLSGMLSSAPACPPRPSLPGDAPMHPSCGWQLLSGVRDSQLPWDQLTHLLGAPPRAPPRPWCLCTLLERVCRTFDRCVLASPCPHVLARLVLRSALTKRPHSRIARSLL